MTESRSPHGGGRERRRHFRLRYPIQKRPFIDVNDHVCQLTELSEGGLRFRCEGWKAPLGEDVTARVHFDDGTTVILVGAEVKRMDGDEVVLTFRDGVSLARMVREQRRIIRASLIEGRPEDLELLRVEATPGRR